MNKKIAWMIVALIMVNLAFSIGISPGRTTLNFEPGREKVVTVDVLNNGGKDFVAVIFAEGTMAEFVELSTNELHFTKDTPKQSFTYTVRLPQSYDPGIQTADIMVTEKASKKAQVTANLGVISALYVNVPYPGVWAEAQLRVDDVRYGEDLNLFFKIFNMGEQAIGSVHAEVELYSQGGLQKTLKTEAKAIGKEKFGELVIKMDSRELKPGDYVVKAKVYYDGNEIELNSKFRIDAFLLELVSISVDDYTLGGIAGFTVLVQNIGNRLVEGFTSRVTLDDVANVKSYAIDVGPDETKKTVAYWDTKDISMGEYEGVLAMMYDDEIAEKDIKTIVNADSIEVEVVSPITGQVILEQPEQSFDIMKYINIIVLVLVVVALIFFSIRNLKKK